MDALAALKVDRSRRRRRVSPWAWLLAIVAVVGGLAVFRLFGGSAVAEVRVAPVVRLSPDGEVLDGSPDLTAAGYVVADRQSVLATKFTGRLARLNVAEAEFVRAGDVVAEIDHSELDATLLQAAAEEAEAAAEVDRFKELAAQAAAEVAAAKSSIETFDAEASQYDVLLLDARRRLALSEKLLTRNAGSLSDVDDRRTEVASAETKIAWTHKRKAEAQRRIAVVEAQANAARAAVAVADARRRSAAAKVKVLGSQRDECFIRAPFDGMVTEKAAELGEIVAPISIGGSMARGSIVTIADWTSLQAEVDVSEAQLARVKVAQRASISVDAIPGTFFAGKVRRILPRADRSKATVKVRVDFLTRDERAVLPEMGVRVRFLADSAPPGAETGAATDVLAAPAAAVQTDGDGRFAWVVSGSDARRVAVVVGPPRGERVEIARGLRLGDQVVIAGAERLRGETVAVRPLE